MDSINDKWDAIMDFLDKLELEEQKSNSLNVASVLKGMLIKDRDEIFRSQSELPDIKPTDGGDSGYIQLSDILELGFKTPEYDSEDYSKSCPSFYAGNETIDAGSYELVSSLKSEIASRIYSKYLDEPTILFRERDRKILLFIPFNNTPLAIKDSGMNAYKVKEDFKDTFNIEFIYLMMRHKRFTDQFPEGMNNLCLLKAFIPNNNFATQQEMITSARKNSCKNLKIALDLLGG